MFYVLHCLFPGKAEKTVHRSSDTKDERGEPETIDRISSLTTFKLK